MRRRAWRVIRLVVVPTIALGAALVVAPDRAELALHIWFLVVLCLVCFALVGVARAAFPRTGSPFSAGMHPPELAVERPGSLARLERELSIAGTSAFDEHHRLRPTITRLAAGLLSSRRGIDLEREPARAQAVLGNDVWELVRPDRPEPTEKRSGGIDERRLGRIVTALERI